MACTDTLKFNQFDLFKRLLKVLPKDHVKTKNIMEIKDDQVFMWDSVDNCLLALNWRAAKAKGNSVKYQKLLLSSGQTGKSAQGFLQPFEIDRIMPSNDGSLIALCGVRGVIVMELPGRWGPNGLFREGSETIFCRSVNLDEKLFLKQQNLEVITAKWHPASPNDSHLLVLLSDNSIRVYNDMKLSHVWHLGQNVEHSRFSMELGENAVDFDFGAPRFVSQNNFVLDDTISGNKKIEWPIFVLNGNGNVDVLSAGLETNRPTMKKNVTMIPRKKDNYGIDSCSILVLSSNPTALVIAESTGKLHHCIVLESEFEKNEESVNESLRLDSDWKLFVLETVELELGLILDPEGKNSGCSIHLKKDPGNDHRYFAYHNTGLHAISAKFVEKLKDFSNPEDSDIPDLSEESRAEYLVCTKAFDNEKPNVVLGLSFIQSPSALILYLNSGQLVSLDLITDFDLLKHYLTKSSTFEDNKTQNQESPLKKILNQSIELQVAEILKEKASQPLLNLDKSSNPSSAECLELLQQAIFTLREHYFTRFNRVRKELDRRVKILQTLKDQQNSAIVGLKTERDQIRENAENLAIKYEDICEKQQILFKRAQEVVRLASLHLPKNTIGEKEFAQQISTINSSTKQLATQLEQINVRNNSFKMQTLHLDNKTKDKQLVLPPNREKIIMDIISDATRQIDSQIKEVKKLNSIVNA